MTIDTSVFGSYTLEELAEIIAQAEAASRAIRDEKTRELRREVEHTAAAMGITVAELVGLSPRRQKAQHVIKRVEPKYRDATDSAKTWTGRGKMPRWLVEKIESGDKLEDFLIQPDLST